MRLYGHWIAGSQARHTDGRDGPAQGYTAADGACDRGTAPVAASRAFHAVWRRANPRGLPMDELVKVIKRAGERVTK